MDEVRETHGVMDVNEKSVTIREREDHLTITVNDGVGHRTIRLDPDCARYLASKLRRLASRVEWRVEVAK